MGTIITLRFILAASAVIIANTGSYFLAQPCDKLDFMLGKETTLARYPDCANFYNGTRLDQNVVVQANGFDETDSVAVAMNMTFGMSFWLAMFLHFIGVEIYVSIIPSLPAFPLLVSLCLSEMQATLTVQFFSAS